MTLANGLRTDSLDKTVASYSAGWELGQVREQLLQTLRYVDLFHALAQEDPAYTLREYRGGYDEYYQLLSLCILFDIDKEHTGKLVALMDFFPDRDAVWEKMIAALGFTGRPPVETLVWPEAYEPLWKVFERHPGNRPEQLKLFADQWYRAMSSTGWYGNHKSKWDVYFGYWCFEAAAVAKMLEVDDSHLKKHKYYPYDIARYSEYMRNQRIDDIVNEVGKPHPPDRS